MKKIAISVLILALLGLGIYYFTRNSPVGVTPTPIDGTAEWETLTDSKQGITFKYPKVIGTQYTTLVDWPPKVEVTNEKVTCLSAGEEIERAGETKPVTVNGNAYCVTKVSEGAAGSTYTHYAYGAALNGRYAFFTFSLRRVQCGNYDEPRKTECEIEQSIFSIDNLMDRIIQTATVEAPKITYNNASADMIVPELPFPEAVVGKTFIATGKARGNWYFEASFPVEVLDKNGKQLVQTYASAQGEWMTTEFVPFISQPIVVPASYIGPATLVLHKDNPSGLPEHEASISFPITIEY